MSQRSFFALLTFFPFFLATLFAPLLAPSLRLLFFAPYLIQFLYKNNLQASMWMAFICGLILDLLTAGNRLGLLTLNLTLTLFLLYPLKAYFFADRLSTLPIMTFLFSALAAFLQLFLEAIFQGSIPLSKTLFSKNWLLSDLILSPAYDALFAFCLIWLSNLILERFKRRPA
jgi:cell shape-determining protein MreD